MRACTLLLLITLIAPLNAAWAEERIVSENPITQYRNSGLVSYSPETYEGLQQLRRGHTDKAYTIWVEQGFQGDIEALALAAMLCKGEEIQPTPDWKMHWGDNNKGAPPPVCPVPARFWEESLIKMLGEGEGTFLLGLFGTELMDYDPFRKASVVYAPIIEAYMLRSALAGNPAGMYGAYLTSEHRNGEHFTPPSLKRPVFQHQPSRLVCLEVGQVVGDQRHAKGYGMGGNHPVEIRLPVRQKPGQRPVCPPLVNVERNHIEDLQKPLCDICAVFLYTATKFSPCN